jgi:PKD repeat protein
VALTATNSAGTNTVTKSSSITVKAPIPAAAFSASPTSGNTPLNVVFTDQSTGLPTSWSWNFGDGTSATTKNPTHTYTKAGSYTVALTATNTAGSNTATKSGYIKVTAPVIPAAAFSGYPTSGTVPLKVQFTDKSTGNPTSWRWTFGDGTYSTTRSPVHTYYSKGRFTVTLTVKNAAGSSYKPISGYIIVT